MANSSRQIGVSGDACGGESRAQRLSALADGELAPNEVASLCATWAQDADSRAEWHSYHLIGDVLRSEDLANAGARDRAFLSALSARLAREPVVFAPAQLKSEPARRRMPWNWVAPAAVAASVVAVSGWVMRPAAPPAEQLARSAAPPAPLAPQVAKASLVGNPGAPSAIAAAPSVGLVMIRDPQLDGYFAAHKQFAGRAAVGMPAGYVRNASVEVPAR